MPVCNQCGETIEFRYVGGRLVPLHVDGGGWACSGGNGSGTVQYVGYSRSDKSCCFLTTCPECRDEVYFIRHNGGSVWIDPPLGWPWYKHRCMDSRYSSVNGERSTLISISPLSTFRQKKGLSIGIVKEAEVSASKPYTL